MSYCLFMLHKWTRWELRGTHSRFQRRTCVRCNRIQERCIWN